MLTTELKARLSDCAFSELQKANTIATNGIRILDTHQRQRLAEACVQEMPADGTIGYAMRRQEAINRMLTTRNIYLRDTIRHLKHSHKLIQMTLNLMTPNQMVSWAKVNERLGLITTCTTRADERTAVLNRFEAAKDALYPAPAKVVA